MDGLTGATHTHKQTFQTYLSSFQGVAVGLPGQNSGEPGWVVAQDSPLLSSPGIAIMMSLCDQVDIYEFLPSKRKTDVCYYYQRYFDSACTMGAYHPLLFEKNMVKHLNLGTDEDIYLLGKAMLPGFQAPLPFPIGILQPVFWPPCAWEGRLCS